MKVSISVDDALMEQIDCRADELFMSRSGFIALACVEKIQQMQAVELLDQMTTAFKVISAKGVVDDEVVQQLDLLCSTLNAIYNK